MIEHVTNYQCVLCKHYLGDAKCEAFPQGIPKEVFVGKVSHTKPIEGDKGIQFEPDRRAEGV